MIIIPLIVQNPVGASVEGAFGHDIIQMVIHAGPMVKFVMGLLVLFSVISWAIILVKFRLLYKARRETEIFYDLFSENIGLKKVFVKCKKLEFSPIAFLFSSGYSELKRIRKIQATMHSEEDRDRVGGEEYPQSKQIIIDNLRRSLKKSSIDQQNKLELALGFLATTGNTAPFIGLFGTVWGIMDAFRGIGLKGSANLAVVAPGISEALIATAAGLAAAIPAVVAFNYFSQKISVLGAEMDIFTTDFLIMVERQLFKEDLDIKAGL